MECTPKGKSPGPPPVQFSDPSYDPSYEKRVDEFSFPRPRSIVVSVEAHNITTGVPFRPMPAPVLCEVHENGLVLEVAERSGGKNHHLLLTLSASIPDQNGQPAARSQPMDPRLDSFSRRLARVSVPEAQTDHQVTVTSTARVQALESNGDGTDRVTIALLQLQRKEWARFLDLFERRQAFIDRFMKAAKGFYAEV